MFRVSLQAPTGFNFAQAYRTQVNEEFNNAAIDLAELLQRTSPRGASGDLAAGWDVIFARRSTISDEVRVSVTNSAPNALFRIRGRAPGKMPYSLDLLDWVLVKIPTKNLSEAKSIAFAIALNIGRRGTKRWRDRRNFAGINLDGTPYPGGAVANAQADLERKLRNIVVTVP